MTKVKQVSSGSLTQGDIEQIERIIYRHGDDVAVSVARSFERLEERIDAMESRLYSRLIELSDGIEETTQGNCSSNSISSRAAYQS